MPRIEVALTDEQACEVADAMDDLKYELKDLYGPKISSRARRKDLRPSTRSGVAGILLVAFARGYVDLWDLAEKVKENS